MPHLRYLNPFPANLGEVLERFERVNQLPNSTSGQLAMLIRAQFLVDAVSYFEGEGQALQGFRRSSPRSRSTCKDRYYSVTEKELKL
jgi:hypothetical protein